MNKELIRECEKYIKSYGIVTTLPLFTPITIPAYELADIDHKAVEDYLSQNRKLEFSGLLLTMIDKTGKKDSEIYKKARMDRRLFSRIRSNKSYIPAKKTVISLCLALECSREESDSLLSSAGYGLSRADDFDLIIAFCIESQVYDFFEINELLDHFGFEVF